MKSFLISNLPLILSTTVSIVAIIVPIYQARMQKKISIMERYLDIQYKAYSNLFREAAKLETDDESVDCRNLIEASYQAIKIAEHISDFCSIYLGYLEDPSDEKVCAEFKTSLKKLSILLRRELFRFDTMKRKRGQP